MTVGSSDGGQGGAAGVQGCSHIPGGCSDAVIDQNLGKAFVFWYKIFIVFTFA